jgi:DNA invertase Pin-like site-specific DNA recombinase
LARQAAERSSVTDTTTPARAVQYLRMSTEHQRYSFENQAAVLAAYALDRGLEIVRSYEDAGKSGLTLSGRKGLQKLLSDALNPERDFEAILVLDVSRWGRFQDPDQAAHYEYICREAGVRVAYCGETFENDGGLVSTIIKHLKRVMAGEYSRELSAKVTRAKLQQARLGFRQGGTVAFGFRRQLIDEEGNARQVLRRGHLKGVHTDRVITVLGPPEEQAVIKRIFRLYVGEGGGFDPIAKRLNAQGVAATNGRPWTGKRVAALIRNELCVGTQVYNRKCRTMRTKLRPNDEKDWVRAPTRTAVVTRHIFARANKLATKGWRDRHSDAELLKRLRGLLKREGYLSVNVVDADPKMPCSSTYLARFGTFKAACALIGYERPPGQWSAAIKGFWTDAVILEGIKRTYDENGYVSHAMITADPQLPGVTTVLRRFGTLLRAYELAGCPQTHSEINRTANQRRSYRTRKKPLDPTQPE